MAQPAMGKGQARAGRPAVGAGFFTPTAVALLCGLLAVGVRAFYLIESADNPFRHHLDLDPKAYHLWAQTILGGTPFGPDPFHQAPLYPYFLAGCYALFGVDPIPPLWIQAILGGITVFLGALIAGRHWGRSALVVTGLILALYKPAIFYSGVLLVPVLATCLLAGALWLQPRRPLCAGICIGLAGLAHPSMLPGGLLCALGFARRTRRAIFLTLAGTALSLAPATVHNALVSGRFVPISANVGINLYIGNGPEANGFYGSPFGMRGEVDPLGVREAARQAGRPLSMVDASRFWTARTRETVAADPARAWRLYLIKLHSALGAYETPQIESMDFERRYSSLLRFPLLPNWITLLGLTGMTLVLLHRDRRVWVLAGAVLATAFLIAVFFVTARFRLPAHLFLALAAGAGLGAVITRLRERAGGWRDAAQIRALAVLGLVLLAFAPNWLAVAKTATFGQYFYRLGVIAEREDRDADARAAYSAALAIDPNVARANINLGILTARQGDLDTAQRLLEKGVGLDPRSARGYLALGQIEQYRENLEGACRLYERAWAADTTFLTGLEFLATAHWARGDTASAERLAADLVRRLGPRAPESARCLVLLNRLTERRRYRWPVWGSRARAAGDLALGARRFAEAQAFYQEAHEADPEDPVALFELARLAAARGDQTAGAVWREKFLAAGGPPEALARLPGSVP